MKNSKMVATRILVFVAVGDNCEALSWLKNFPKRSDLDFSILLVYYGSNVKFHGSFTDSRVSIINDSSPSKFEKFKKYIDAGTITLENYDLIWLADDDIRIDEVNILKFFDTVLKHNLEIAQPGCLGFAMGKQIVRRDLRYILRYSNYVDGMAPLFTQSALNKCLPTFQNCESGRGIDHVWAAMLGNPLDKIAIIDSSLMIHMKPSGIDYSRFSNSIQEQYLRVKTIYGPTVEMYYAWDDLVVHNSINALSRIRKLDGVNKIQNKLVEIRNIGISKLLQHLIFRFKQRTNKFS
jgi:Protein of unknown function (DUF707)